MVLSLIKRLCIFKSFLLTFILMIYTICNFFCFLCVLVGISPLANAQFDPENFDRKRLEHEIKTLIDSTRLTHQLPALYNDSILYLAADYHANYLVSKGFLTHEETDNKPYLTPQDRARKFGAPGNYYVGENLVMATYNASVKVKNKTFQTFTYTEIARCLVHSWINSKPHYQNIIHPDYQVTGLAVGIDPATQRIYACQKFAQVLYTYAFPESTTLFPHSTLANSDQTMRVYPVTPYPFKLKDDHPETCEECRSVWENYPPISVRVDKGNFVLRVEDAAFVQDLILNKHDGFAVEIVPFDAFACGNPAYEEEPSRRNNLKRTSGLLLEPVYRKDLLKGFKKRKKIKGFSYLNYLLTADSVAFFKRFGRYNVVNFKAEYFEMKLGKVPKNLSFWWNHNLVYIHDRQICHISYLTNYPGELDTQLVDVDYFPPKPINNYTFALEYYTDTLELFYQAGKTVTSGNELNNLVQRFEQQHLTIQSIQIDGFCSVEGDSLTNETLHRKRAENILSEVKKLTDNSTKYTLNSTVDWEHFYATTAANPKWKFLSTQSKNQIKVYLSNPKNVQPVEILANERRVKVRIVAVKEFTPKTARYYVNRDLKQLFIKDAGGVYFCKDQLALQRLYEKAYYLCLADTLDTLDFLAIEFPKVKGGFSHTLQHDRAFYHYHLLRETATKTQLSKLESAVEAAFNSCGAAEHLSPEFHYLSACLLVNKIKQYDPKKAAGKKSNFNADIDKAFERMNLLLSAYDLDSAFLFNVSKANLNIINVICTTIDPNKVYEYSDDINNSLIHLFQYYRNTHQLKPERVLRLAKTACYFNNIALAVSLCQEFLDNNEILKLYLPLAYNHSSYLSSEADLEFEKAFHQLLIEAHDRLTQEEWCKLFYGNYGIPFQLMDNANLHKTFCETCPNRVTEALEE